MAIIRMLSDKDETELSYGSIRDPLGLAPYSSAIRQEALPEL
jgi:hypothetical protein